MLSKLSKRSLHFYYNKIFNSTIDSIRYVIYTIEINLETKSLIFLTSFTYLENK